MKPGGFVRAVMLAGFLFLWLPILLLVGFAFSADRIPFQWGGFSLRWFGVLAANERLLEAAWLSLRIAAASATLAVLMGGGIAFALARFGWPAGRGAFTILLAHAGFGAAYVAVVVQARLAEAERSLEEAAMDLGATPLVAFRTITLPLIAPALIAGWLLAFTLSLDDVVIASFVSGPAGTTLPIALFSMLRLGLTPEVNALGALVVLVVGSMLALALWLLGRRQA